MTQTGQTERIRIAVLEKRRQQIRDSITARLTDAFNTYRWHPLPEVTHVKAWERILDFVGHLLGISTGPHTRAAATLAIHGWMRRLNRDLDDAIDMLLRPDNDPDLFLHEIGKAAIEAALIELDEWLMQYEYELQGFADRVTCVHRMREAFPIMNSALNELPSWSYVEELPRLHRMCVEELAGTELQQPAFEAR